MAELPIAPPGRAGATAAPELAVESDESPTMLKRDSSVRMIRNLVDVVPRLTVDVKREGEGGERHFVHQGELCRIGTHSSNDLVLRDPAVSRFHCKLTRDGLVWRLHDSGSLNGT